MAANTKTLYEIIIIRS